VRLVRRVDRGHATCPEGGGRPWITEPLAVRSRSGGGTPIEFRFAPGTLHIQQGATLTFRPAGTTLHYLCAIHSWMQGKLVVE
jgi:hypothetical protein